MRLIITPEQMKQGWKEYRYGQIPNIIAREYQRAVKRSDGNYEVDAPKEPSNSRVMRMDTLESQRIRYASIDAAPEHKVHTVYRNRVDTWYDEEAHVYIARVPECMTQGYTEEHAIEAAKSMLKCHAEWTLAAAEGKPWPKE